MRIGVFLLFLWAAMQGTGPAQKSTPAIRVETALVNVPVIVSDPAGRSVRGLKKGDFTLYQDGDIRSVDLFVASEEPLSVALLLDTSKSTASVLGKIKKAAREFLRQLRPKDRALVAVFDSDVRVAARLGADRRTLEEAVEGVEVGGGAGTRMRDAVLHVIERRLGKVSGRKAVILLTDGQDNGSTASAAELISKAAESGTVVYSVFYRVDPRELARKLFGISVPSRSEGSPEWQRRTEAAARFLDQLCRETSGRLFQSQIEDLKEAFAQISEELRHQYLLGFYPDPSKRDGKVHQLQVEVARAGVAVRSRPSYVALPPNP